MTKAEAIEVLKNTAWLGTDIHMSKVDNALRVIEQENISCDAVNIWSGHTTIPNEIVFDFSDGTRKAVKVVEDRREQEPCEDAISRAELLKAIDTWDKFGCDADTKLVPYQDHYIPYIHYEDVIKAIKGMPSVQPSRKGHWITTDYFKFTCSECGWEGNCDTKFCSNCGAEMESEK